jgi:hypothetical protein
MGHRSSYYEYNFQMSCIVGLELAGRLGGLNQECLQWGWPTQRWGVHLGRDGSVAYPLTCFLWMPHHCPNNKSHFRVDDCDREAGWMVLCLKLVKNNCVEWGHVSVGACSRSSWISIVCVCVLYWWDFDEGISTFIISDLHGVPTLWAEVRWSGSKGHTLDHHHQESSPNQVCPETWPWRCILAA